MEKIKNLTVSGNTKLIDVHKKMDVTEHKLLLVIDDSKFIGVISIGDLQRCILKCMDLNNEVRSIIRSDIIFASEETSMESIK